MKKNDKKVKVLGAVPIAAGAALVGRIIYDFKKIRQLTKEEADFAGEPEEPVAQEPAETEAPAAQEPAAEEAPAEEAPAEEAPAPETEAPAGDAKAE